MIVCISVCVFRYMCDALFWFAHWASLWVRPSSPWHHNMFAAFWFHFIRLVKLTGFQGLLFRNIDVKTFEFMKRAWWKKTTRWTVTTYLHLPFSLCSLCIYPLGRPVIFESLITCCASPMLEAVQLPDTQCCNYHVWFGVTQTGAAP